MSKLRNSIIRRRKKREESYDDNDIDNRNSGSKLKRNSSCVSREVLLHHAVTQENLTTAMKLLENEEVDVNFVRPPGVTALHIACVAGNVKFVSVLTEKGADITKKTSLGLSPLRLAFIFGHFDVAELLITLGSDPNDIKDGFQHDSCKDNIIDPWKMT